MEKKVEQLLKDAMIEAKTGVANAIYYLGRNTVGDHLKKGKLDKLIRRRVIDLMGSEEFHQKIKAKLLATPTITTTIEKCVTKKVQKAVNSERRHLSKQMLNVVKTEEKTEPPSLMSENLMVLRRRTIKDVSETKGRCRSGSSSR